MPLYDYRCSACGEDFEHLQGLSEPDPERSECCEAPVVRMSSIPADFRGRFQAPACSSCMDGPAAPDTPPCAAGGSCGLS